ncbi:MAG TPA: PQQ-binding-like beta-propeller repeat protein [Solirubrobacteraceae bacterium]|nr:PQQ-binding-like beta-propeller repeat protein [Solirubrobacteraceae bacterium]
MRPPRASAVSAARRIPRLGWFAAAALVALGVAAIAIASLGLSSSPYSSLLTGSGYPNANTANTRYAGGPIDSSTVSKLEAAWSLPLTAKSEYGSYSSTPIIANGVIYSQDLASNVQAIDLETGKVIWSKSYESPDQGPNGLVVQDGIVFGATATAAFALDQKTGAQIWTTTLVRNEHEGIDMAPGYHDGIVYVSTVPGNNRQFYGGEAVGVLWALDGRTGARLWHFDTAPESLWSSENAGINSGGGLWYSPAFDEHGNMFIGTGNPAPFPGTSQYPWGASRPGPNLYTDSIVKLNAHTGTLEWYHQLTPHDLYDHDLQDPPILANVAGRQVVLAAGKAGLVICLDAQTGKLLWEHSVGIHNGHDQDGLYAMRHEYSKLHLPETVYPGLLGGVIAPMATNGASVFVPVVNHSVTYENQSEPSETGPATGEIVALSATTGAVEWDRKLPAAAYGATTAVNDLVFATDFEGKLFAFDAHSGETVWETQLPAGTNTGIAVAGNTLIAPAGIAIASGQTPEISAYRLPAG